MKATGIVRCIDQREIIIPRAAQQYKLTVRLLVFILIS